MRVHTNVLTFTMIVHALAEAQADGHVALSVVFKTLEEHRSTTHLHAFEVQLESDEKLTGDGRRWGNSGSYGAGDAYTATYDEWGWFIAELYKDDPSARWGSAKNPTYRSKAEFHRLTGLSYNPAVLRQELSAQPYPGHRGEDPYPFIISRSGGHAGRIGHGRSDGEGLPRREFDWLLEHPGERSATGAVFQPRTLESIV